MAEEIKQEQAETTQEVKDTETSSGQDEQVEKKVETTKEETSTLTQEDYKKAVEEATKEASNKTKRELSKTLGVNLFDEKETQSFIDGLSNKVDKSEIEKYEEQLKEYDTIKKEREELAFDNVIIKNGIKEEYQDKVKRLANDEVSSNGLTREEAVKKVLDDFPMFKGTRKAGIDLNDDNTTLTDAERYMRDNYEYKDGKPVRRKK